MVINNLNNAQHLSLKKPNNPSVSFKGHKLEDGQIKFFIPGSSESKATVNYKDNDDNGKLKHVPLTYQNGMLIGSVALAKPNQRLAYNFTVDGKTQVDLTERTKNENFAITQNPQMVSFEKPHNIYHVLPDSFNPDASKLTAEQKARLLDKDGNFIWRNHFDLYGGNIKTVIEKLDYIKELGAGRIMGTPVFGHDTLSNHGYWTENPYQICSRMGNTEDFNTLNIELFKKDMGWIADGAFVNQGLMGVQFQDILRRAGKESDKSAFVGENETNSWFTFYGEPGKDFVIGVLPSFDDGSINFDAFDLNFENAPLNIDGTKNNDFNPDKPTFLAIVDPRNNKQDAGVHVSTESVQPYKFPINPDDVTDKYEYKTPEKTDLLEWSNFTLDSSDYDSLKQLWNGNRDVLKMNMKNPDVVNYIMEAGKFWTSKVDNTLLKYISKELTKELDEKKPTTENIISAITSLQKKGKLPESSKGLQTEEIKKALFNKDIAKLKDQTTLLEAVKAYPLEAIEFPPEISAIITNPDFKNQMQAVYDKEVSQVLENILNSKELYSITKEKLQQPELIRLVAHDLAKSLMVKAISNLGYWPETDDRASLNIGEQIKEATYKNLDSSILYDNADVAVNSLINQIKDGLSEVKTDEIAQILNSSLENIDKETVRTAKALLTKTESGLDWRIDAAKDVADLDAVDNERLSKDDAIDFAVDFWSQFGKNVREINPKAYLIGEVTEGDNILPKFIKEDAFSTVSNYRYMWGQPYRFVHAHPEPMYGWNYGPTEFANDLEQFVKAWPITAVNTAHNMVDNHDKAMVLFNLLMHPGDFMSDEKGPQYAMKAVLNRALSEVSNLQVNTKTAPVKVDTSKDPVAALITKSIEETSNKAGEQFGFWSLPKVFEAIQKNAETTATAKDKKALAQVPERLTQMAKNMFDNISDKYLRMLYLQVGVPGSPEIYAGTELGMTGGESNKVNNKYIQNRNPLPWVWLDAKNGKPEVIEFNNRVKQIFNLRQNNNLKVLNNGFVKDLNIKDDENGVYAFMRYNDSQQALVILNNGKVNPSANAAENDNNNLAITQPVAKNYKLDLSNSGIEAGTVFINGVNQSEKYVVGNDGILHPQDNAKNGVDIEHGLILYRENQAVKATPKTKVSFSGKLNRIV